MRLALLDVKVTGSPATKGGYAADLGRLFAIPYRNAGGTTQKLVSVLPTKSRTRDGSIHSQFFVAECHVPQFSIQEGETFPLTYYPLSDVYTKKAVVQGHRAAREALAF